MQNLLNAVDKHRDLILKTERFIWQHPETGYREEKTSGYMKDVFTSLGYELQCPDNLTGFVARIETGRPGPELLILGELDSVVCPSHPEANPETGAVHACGHNAQCAALVGIAAALREPGVLDQLSGSILLCAVPAEELLELEYRNQLREEGKIRYFVGKPEFLSRGLFDGVDLAFMVHTSSAVPAVQAGSVGCIAKRIAYKGVSAHAGGAPWDGRNALYAASCGLNAVNAIRETFREQDIIRVHPIITHGGDVVNAIPENVQLESFVRGSGFEGIAAANRRVNQALTGAALSLDNNIEIIDIPGYAPLRNDQQMKQVVKEAAAIAMPELPLYMDDSIGSGSTDMGDLSCIMPVVHPYMPGAVGTTHGNNYYIQNPELACVTCAKWQLVMAALLLGDGAERAKKIVAEYKPLFAGKQEYLAYLDSLNASGDRIVYTEDGTAQVRL